LLVKLKHFFLNSQYKILGTDFRSRLFLIRSRFRLAEDKGLFRPKTEQISRRNWSCWRGGTAIGLAQCDGSAAIHCQLPERSWWKAAMNFRDRAYCSILTDQARKYY
jgi:hypothetical protein